MIYKNNKTINEWYFNDAELIKVYKNGAICYYKMVLGETPSQEPCFAVVDNIQSYSDTEFVDVYDKATDKWYKLNNLDQYEQYGVYGEGRNITYYEGKLTIDNGYEYEWDGSEWVSLGEVSGSTATLPDVPFMVNYNAKNYDATNRKLPKTDGQSRNSDAVCNYGYHIVDHSADGYITVTGNTRMIISGTPYFNRTNTQTGCTMTIVSKVRTTNATQSYSILTNRGSYTTMNWMWRYPSNGIFLHGSSAYNNPKYLVSTTGQPITASIRISYDGSVKQQLNDWTNNGSYSGDFQYGSDYNGNNAMFCDYTTENAEYWKGDFYWVYMSFNVLTDAQIQQVIAYNEGNNTPDYPKYYTEKDEPENNVVFTDMTEALAYECPWVGMKAIIGGDRYIFTSGYTWEEDTSTVYATLQELAQTHTVVQVASNKYTLEPTISGITFFRLNMNNYGNGYFTDLYRENLDQTNYFGIKDDSFGSLYKAIDGYSTIKDAANSSSCTWAYWIDQNTIEVNVVEAVQDTIFLGFYTNGVSMSFISFPITS